MTEFNLSKKIYLDLPNTLFISDVKEFIKKLKHVVIPVRDIIGHSLSEEQLFKLSKRVNDEIDKLAGEELSK